MCEAAKETLMYRTWQPTRLPRPWDSPGKNTGVGCHFLLQCMKVKSESEVAQLCPTHQNHYQAYAGRRHSQICGQADERRLLCHR